MYKFGHHHHAPVVQQMIGDVRRREKMLSIEFYPDVSSPKTIGDISPNSAQQSANIRRSTPRFRISQTIGETSATRRRCTQHARVNIGDVYRCDNIADDLCDPSPMFPNCSAKHQRCYGDVFACVLFYLQSVIRQQNKSDLFFTHNLIPMLSTRHHIIAMTSSRHLHNIITITLRMHRRSLFVDNK